LTWLPGWNTIQPISIKRMMITEMSTFRFFFSRYYYFGTRAPVAVGGA
jgi:hypothetical protein